MPFLPSQDFLERVRQPVPPPFANWGTWQRQLFAWSAVSIWSVLVGAASVGLIVIWLQPRCENLRSGLFNAHCHTTIGIGICVSALVVLWLLYLKFEVLVSQIAYIRRSNYGVDESESRDGGFRDES